MQRIRNQAVLAGPLIVFSSSWAFSSQPRNELGSSEVIIFTLPECMYCKHAKDHMTRKRIPFREMDLSTPEGMRAAEELQIKPMAPVFSYKNRTLHGYTAERLIKFIEE